MIANIREVALSDFEEIVVLLKQLWPDKELNHSALMKVFFACLKSPDYIYMCAEIDGKVIGLCSLVIRESLWVEGLIGHINELIVDESLRRMKIGTELLEATITAAKKKECKRIELDSAFYREDAHKFYEREGFTKRAYLFSKMI